MKNALALLLTASLLTFAVPPAGGRQAPGAAPRRLRHERAVAGSYIVVLKSDVAAAEVNAAAERLTRPHGGQLVASYRHALRGFSARMSPQAAEALSRHPLVAYVEDDAVVELAATQTNAPWGLDRTDQRDLPLSNTYTYANSGAGAHVYIIDSGIRTTHQEFGGRASVAFDNVGDSQNGEDCFGHGTQVAGVVGGATYGAAKGAQLHAVRVFSCTNTSTLTKVIEGVDFVTSDHLSPAVAVLSVSTGGSTSLDTAVSNSITSGVTYVVAAGNINTDASTRSPARVAEAITVGATDDTDTRASFSNYGSALDLFAPGVNIPTANWFSDSSTISQNGTSLAAAHVAGLAARYLSGNPGEPPEQVARAITANATAGEVINEGTNSPDLLLYTPMGKVGFTQNFGRSFEIYVMGADGSDETRYTFNTGKDSNPVWSPDGTKIAFSSIRDNNADVYVMNADGSGQTRLTNSPELEFQPAWSPDGTKIAFSGYLDGDYLGVCVMNADGSNQHKLTADVDDYYQPVWSPDGTKIAFVNDTSFYRALNVMNADGTGQTQLDGLLSYEPASWSPDSTKIVFGRIVRDYTQIYVINADGTNLTRLTNNSSHDLQPIWSPAGTKIAFTSYRDGNGEVYTMNPDGTDQTNVSNNSAHDGAGPWSPDGTKLVFSSDRDGNDEIYSMNANGSGQTRLTDDAAWDYVYSWSPDGDQLAFSSMRDAVGYEVGTADPDGHGEKSVLNSPTDEQYPVWSPDGRKLLFVETMGASELYVMNSDGSGRTGVTQNSLYELNGKYTSNLYANWSPDGTRISFIAYSPDDICRLYVINADGTGQTAVASYVGQGMPASWSPDSTKLSYNGTEDGNSEIYVVNADGTSKTRLTNNAASDFYPSWSPDGTKIAFTSDRNAHNLEIHNTEIYVMNADGSNQTRLTNDAAFDTSAVWSPDGTKLAFVRTDYDTIVREIYVMDADGSNPVRLTNDPRADDYPMWSPDGSKIAFAREGHSGVPTIYVMNADGTGLTGLTTRGTFAPPTWQPL